MPRGRIAVLAVASLALGAAVALALLGGGAGLRVGDCFDPPETRGGLEDLKPVPCTAPHQAEIFLVLRYPDAPAYPDEFAFGTFVSERCVPAYRDYAGHDLMTANDVDVGWFFPTEESWGRGDRAVRCYATTVDGQPRHGSLRAGSLPAASA